MFKILKFLELLAVVSSATTSPFTSYEDALLNQSYPIQQIQLRFLAEGSGDSIGFGFWTQCIPLWSVKQQKQVDSPFNTQLSEEGQFVFLLKSEISKINAILFYVKFDQLIPSITHSILLDDTQEQKILSKLFPPLDYEGIWILTYFTLQLTKQVIIIEISNQNSDEIPFSIDPGDYQLIIGGRGYIQFGSQSFNLNFYRGRLSVIIYEESFNYNQDHFINVENLYQIPPKIIGVQEVYLLQGLQYFSGSNSKISSVEEYGNRFALSGWIKLDASKIVSSVIFEVIRITVFQDFTSQVYLGDEIFQLYYQIIPGFQSYFSGLTNQYSIPIIQEENFNDYVKENFWIDISTPTVTMFEVLQEWHFIQYEYGRTQDCRSSITAYFSKLDVETTQCLSKQDSYGQYTNTKFYVILGGSTFVSLKNLEGYLCDIQFTYNYSSDLDFTLSCHYTCSDCFGPLYNNCKTCPQNSNRYYLSEQQACRCEKNYLDIEGQSNCLSFLEVYATIQETEISETESILCKFGYFQILIDQYYCVKCPHYQGQQINCVDCLFNPQTWYQNPKCTQDMVTYIYDGESAFSIVNDDLLNQDIYYIDQNYQTQLYLGVQDYCNSMELQINCFQTKVEHLGRQVSVICKDNHYFLDDQCILLDPYCLKVDSQQCLQCVNNYYLFENRCHNCPLKCVDCNFNYDTQSVYCLACNEGYALVDGDCLICGRNCKICQNYLDKILGKNYLRCYRCVDDQKYLLSLDAVNCLLNPIENCLFAFQVLQDDYKINSLDYYFIPQYTGNIITVCAACDRSFLYVIPTQTCVPGFEVNCVFGVSNVENPTQDDQICLYIQIGYGIYQFEGGVCQGLQNQCDTCIYGRQSDFIQCITCNAGYFSQKLLGVCKLCPKELNCLQCYQQDKYIKDNWKINIQAFYKYTINSDYKHAFILHGQSQQLEDYEIVCNSCQTGYELYQDKCILSCPQECLECQIIDGQNKCIKCYLDEFGRQLSLFNNSCISCPSYCALCRIRAKEEILQINPLFQSSEFISSTYQCLKAYESVTNLFYDQQLGQFIHCSTDQACKRTFLIIVNLYCSIKEYNQELAKCTSDDMIREFKQANILINDLFSNNHSNFPEFEQYYFYYNANQKSIKQIKIQIVSQKQQVCTISGDQILTQLFSQNIFSTIDVQIQFIAQESTIMQFDRTITFANFTSITFKNIQFQSIANERKKQILFESAFPQIVLFNDCSFKQLKQDIDYMQFIFKDLQKFELVNFITYNLLLSNNGAFFIIHGGEQLQQIQISGLKINNNSMKNTNFIQIYGNKNLVVQMSDITVYDSYFFNSMLITFNYYTPYDATLKQTKLSLQKLIIINTSIKSTSGFFNIFEISEVQISVLLINDSMISQTVLIMFGNDVSFQTVKIQDCKIEANSNLFLNLDNLQSEEIIIFFQDLAFELNQYDNTIKFIKLLSYQSSNQKIYFNQTALIGNRIFDQIAENQQLNYQTSLIYISCDTINIKTISIERGIGLPELSLVNSNYLSIDDLTITQGEDYKFRPLTQYLDCLLQYLTQPYYPPSLFIRSPNVTIINKVNIYSTYTFNQPLISFSFPDVQKAGQNGQISIKNGFLNQNILVIQQQLRRVGLIFIQSNQLVKVEMKNLTFFGNLLHEYVQSELIISATLINIDCLQCEILLSQLTITSNLVLNATDSIIYINSNSINIEGSIFQSNSKFQYSIIRPFIILGDDQIYLEQLEATFQVLSYSGNGIFQSQDLSISNCQVFNSSGRQGGAFKIMLQSESYFECNNTVFDTIQTQFSQGQSGGILNIDTKYSSTCIIKIANIKIKNSFSSSLGGFIYIINGQGSLELKLQHLDLNNLYAKLGSIIYCSFLSTSNYQQILKIEGILYHNDLEQFATFLSKFTTTQKAEVSEILNQRSLIYVEYGNMVTLSNFFIENLYYESLFDGQSISDIRIKNIKISNSQFTPYLINIAPNANVYFSIGIQGLEVSDSNQITLQYEFMQCFQKILTIPVYQFHCENIFETLILPEMLENIIIEDNKALLKCFKQVEKYYIINSVINAGMINIADLNQVREISISQMTFKNFNCKYCNLGLFSLIFQQSAQIIHQIKIQSISIKDSQCGKSGCIILRKEQFVSSVRLLNDIYSSIWPLGYDLHISDYFCTNNTASYGVCLNIQSFSSVLSKCTFKGNSATKQGGAIYLIDTKGRFIISDSQITQNSAEIGGGISALDSVLPNFELLKTVVKHNVASYYGDNQVSLPLFLKLSLNITVGAFENYIIAKNDNILIQGIINSDTILNLPSGQSISEYFYFDWKSQSYIYPSLIFRLTAVDQYDTIYKDLTNHYCSIKSRVFNFSDREQNNFTNNFTNIKQLYFNNTTQDFNLDNLSIAFDSDQPKDIVLQLEIQCSPIVVPTFNKETPYNLLGTHSNYYLRINIRTLPCTFGQIKNTSDFSCYMCNSSQNYFSLRLGASKCQIIDDITTISVESAKLQLRQSYWRPYFDTSDITYCLNLPINCNGGWIPGDNSCVNGHIGALCEQCDLYNIRGEGYFSFSQKYTCSLCSSTSLNLGVLIGTIIWQIVNIFFRTFVSLVLSVRSTLQTAQKHIRQAQSKIIGLSVFYKIEQSGVIIKILTNYLQIIASLSTFQLHLPIDISNIINVFGNPVQSISYTQDCVISKLWNIPIHYSRIIWQLLLPFFFYAVFFIVYFLLVKIDYVNFNFSVMTTSVFYLFIYFQPNWIYELIQLFSFRNISGFQWIQNNVAYRYDTSQHQEWILRIFLPILIFLIVLIPLIFLVGLISNRHKLNNKQTHIIWGYLYNEYSPKSYFWEVLKIVQKDLIIITLVYYEEDVVVKGILVIFIVQIYQILNSIYLPYYLYKFNSIDMQTANVCQMSFILGVGIYISNQNSIKEIRNLCYVLLAIFNIFQFLSLLVFILQAYVTEAEGILDKLRDKLSEHLPEKFKTRFVTRLLINQGERRRKIQENFLRIKYYLLKQAKLIIELKQPQNFKSQFKSTHNLQIKKQILKIRSPPSESEGLIILNHLSPSFESQNFRSGNAKSPNAKSPYTKSPLKQSSIIISPIQSNSISPITRSHHAASPNFQKIYQVKQLSANPLIEISEEDDVQIDKIDEDI